MRTAQLFGELYRTGIGICTVNGVRDWGSDQGRILEGFCFWTRNKIGCHQLYLDNRDINIAIELTVATTISHWMELT